jgi:hypothetical protein
MLYNELSSNKKLRNDATSDNSPAAQNVVEKRTEECGPHVMGLLKAERAVVRGLHNLPLFVLNLLTLVVADDIPQSKINR